MRRGDTYEKLCWSTVVLAGTLMAEAVEAWRAGTLTSRPQGEGGETHRNMSDEVLIFLDQLDSNFTFI